MSGKAISFLAAFVAFVFLVPILLSNLLVDDDVYINVLRCLVMLIAALMVWSRRRTSVILGAAVSGLFAIGSLSRLVGAGTGTNAEGVIGLFALAAAFALAWYGAPLFRRNEIAVTPGQYVYGSQPSEWGRGSGDSSRSGIWVMGLLLNRLVRIPGIYVFHGLKSPGAKRIDVEHVVTHGNSVYLIDSWLDLPTKYGWHPNRKGLAASSKGDDGHRHTKIADAADRYRAALGRGVNVVPIIAVVSGTASIGPERWSPRGVGLFTADEVLRFIGDGAVEGLPTFHERPAVRELVASTVESYA
ncbi:hypothetical protein [Pseudarthrobacter sulfonivorans]|uniref:hypothetical protein n=1 Tax=Pseudarthrobacter sulfonivorans TaxID=121292 RepID=UPI002865FE55|nr:hypothetical protein [Pseudarthrobacter sulfonivorans]MDR6416836.1 hypothetical protein [Pseudarthrobacter sulfonivorans]